MFPSVTRSQSRGSEEDPKVNGRRAGEEALSELDDS